MKIGILSRGPKLYSTCRLVEAAKQRGHHVQVIDPLKCFMNINSTDNEIHYQEKILHLDAVVSRIGASVSFYGTAVVRQFEMSGIYALNGSLAITRARDKLRAHQILSRKKLGMPITGFAHSTSNIDDLIKVAGGAPLVIKLLEGAQGKGVILAETKKAAESVIEAFRGLDAHFLIQEFIKEAGGEDIRCFVIGEKVVATMMRKATDGDFRSNLHSGGIAEKIKITPEERRTAITAAKAIGLDVAGVDLIRSHRGPLILEVNSSPGLEGIEKTSGKDIAALMIEHVEKNVEISKKSRTNKG
ncbi:MAG: 30S ribosomal protein S6--L-glutamate ligase [Rhodospirillales bacterium]|nr:30S ribosomal protein S6--L-glutamate ligase [Alphaproteobacteria bacterium]USO03060.1 MAG: 30S ribosomal protein S6--L-glutamate ligase [Rhodospirillales bacterium]